MGPLLGGSPRVRSWRNPAAVSGLMAEVHCLIKHTGVAAGRHIGLMRRVPRLPDLECAPEEQLVIKLDRSGARSPGPRAWWCPPDCPGGGAALDELVVPPWSVDWRWVHLL